MIKYPDDFIAAGYKEWKSKQNMLFKMTEILMQKCIEDSIGKRYFIDIYVYDNKEMKRTEGYENMPDFSFMPEVQFRDENGESIMNCTCMGRKDSIEDIEKFFHDVWFYLDYGYYRKWDGEED